MFSIISDTEISEMLIPRNTDFFLTCCLKEYDRLFCLVFLHPSIIAYYIILSTKYHIIDLWKCWDIGGGGVFNLLEIMISRKPRINKKCTFYFARHNQTIIKKNKFNQSSINNENTSIREDAIKFGYTTDHKNIK